MNAAALEAPSQTLVQLAQVTPALVAAISDILRENIDAGPVNFILIALPARDMAHAAFGTNFPLVDIASLRAVINAALDAAAAQSGSIGAMIPRGNA